MNKLIQNGNKITPRIAIALALFVLLPVLLGGVYVVQRLSSRASEVCPAYDVTTQRLSENTGQVSFSTNCPVKAQIFCAVGKDGVQFFCGEDQEATMNHIIMTSDDVTLSTGIGYYVFINTGFEEKEMSYISADPTDPTFGLDANLYNDVVVGVDETEAQFDPALDLNHDGFINMQDKAEFYDWESSE